jgi:8-oxo-dGTP pyrophosphatase MutT (NUDIX family)
VSAPIFADQPLAPGIVTLRGIEAVVEPYHWAFEADHAAEIEAIWQREINQKDQLYNGEVLLQHAGHIIDGVFHARYFLTRYKPFFAWIRLGCPPPILRNGFAMAALRTWDGAFLLGEMAAHTANAGRVYFPAGTPDRDDLIGSQVDLYGSACRELQEETGISLQDVEVSRASTAVIEQNRVAFIFPAQLNIHRAEDARERILTAMSHLKDQELSDIVIVRNAGDLDFERMPNFQTTYLRHIFGV